MNLKILKLIWKKKPFKTVLAKKIVSQAGCK